MTDDMTDNIWGRTPNYNLDILVTVRTTYEKPCYTCNF